MNTAILDTRPAAMPDLATRLGAGKDLLRLLALDHLPQRRLLACHWRRGADGRLCCVWEPDLRPVPYL